MVYHLLGKVNINSKTGCNCSYFHGPDNESSFHDHDFFEFFITLNDKVIHETGGERTKLKKGTLVLIRPLDVHRYADEGQGDFYFVNLTFSQETFWSTAKFLCAENLMQELLSAKKPPFVVLTAKQSTDLTNQFLNLMGDSVVQNPLSFSRGMIASVFSDYFLNQPKKESRQSIPAWFTSLCNELHKAQNLSLTPENLCAIAGHSYGYIGHCFQKYVHKSPTEYLKEIKLTYAKNMLLHTNMSIIEISLECGFENLGYFYKLFKEKNGIAPGKFRKQMQMEKIL